MKTLKQLWRRAHEFYLRGRYGWAPSDTWSLDDYLARVVGESLTYLAEHLHSAPSGYPKETPACDDQTGFEQWEADLKRWGSVFKDYAERWECETIEEENQRYLQVKQVLAELTPWFGALWD